METCPAVLETGLGLTNEMRERKRKKSPERRTDGLRTVLHLKHLTQKFAHAAAGGSKGEIVLVASSCALF